jgi:hypothetical protein
LPQESAQEPEHGSRAKVSEKCGSTAELPLAE